MIMTEYRDGRIYTEPTDYFNEVTKGTVAGHRSLVLTGSNEQVGTTFEDVSTLGGTRVFPTVAETLEVVSDSADDTALGSGARTVVVSTLDETYERVRQTVIMNGTTPVALTGTHIRTTGMVALTSGSNNANVGFITLQSTGGANAYEGMLEDEGASTSAIYTVPKGVKTRALTIDVFTPKGQDITVKNVIQGPDGTVSRIGGISTYQTAVVLPLKAPVIFPERTDLIFRAKSSNNNIAVTIFAEYLEIKNG